jgi:hypothetical protein
MAAGVARVADVYVLWKRAEAASLVDGLTAAVAGGPHVHVELCFRCSALPAGEAWSLLTVGSIWPMGVYASDVLTDAFYGVAAPPRGGPPADAWTWLNVTAWYPTPAERLELWRWSAAKVGPCGYATRSAAAFCLPGGDGVRYGADVLDKRGYLCSELVADGLFRAMAPPGHAAHDPAVRGLALRCRGSGWAAGGTSKLSPQALYEFFSEEGRSVAVGQADVRASAARGALAAWGAAPGKGQSNAHKV